mgnify:CR=1 FL=1
MPYQDTDDHPNECNAHLYIGDDYGDNHATMRCQELPGHPLPHREKFTHSRGSNEIDVTWTIDEREENEEPE